MKRAHISPVDQTSIPCSDRLILLIEQRVKLVSLGLVLLVLLTFLTLPVAAQDSGNTVTDDDVNAIAKELYCPICESTPLDVCATQACADWRQVIRDKLGEGQTEADIKAYFLDQYGPRALAEPPRSGITQLLWILPIVVVIVGAGLFYRYMRATATAEVPMAATQDSDSDHGSETATDDDYRSRIERELREM